MTDLDERIQGGQHPPPREQHFRSNIGKLILNKRGYDNYGLGLLFSVQHIENAIRRNYGTEPIELVEAPEQAILAGHSSAIVKVDDIVKLAFDRFAIDFRALNDYVALYLLFNDSAHLYYKQGKLLEAYVVAASARQIIGFLNARDEGFLEANDDFKHLEPSNIIKSFSFEAIPNKVDFASALEHGANDIASAIKVLEETAQSCPKYYKAGLLSDEEFVFAQFYLHLGLGRLYRKKGDSRNAIDNLLEARSISEAKKVKFGFIYSQLSELFFTEGRTYDAIAELDQARRIFIENPDVYNLSAVAFCKIKEYDGALQNFAIALHINPNNFWRIDSQLTDEDYTNLLRLVESNNVVASFAGTSQNIYEEKKVLEGERGISESLLHVFNGHDTERLNAEGVFERKTDKYTVRIEKDVTFTGARPGTHYQVRIAIARRTPECLRAALAAANDIHRTGVSYFNTMSRMRSFGYDLNPKIVVAKE